MGLSWSSSPAITRYGILSFSPTPFSEKSRANLSNSASSVKPAMYMNLNLKVGEATLKSVFNPGSWHTERSTQPFKRSSTEATCVPQNDPMLTPDNAIRSGSISFCDRSHDRTKGPACIQFVAVG